MLLFLSGQIFLFDSSVYIFGAAKRSNPQRYMWTRTDGFSKQLQCFINEVLFIIHDKTGFHLKFESMFAVGQFYS